MGAEKLSQSRLSSASWSDRWPLIGIFAVAAFLRLFQIGDQLIIDDEWHALNAVQDHDYGWIFSHLGHADHSIPLTLLYEFFSHTIGLSELVMRMPSLVAGLLAILLLPRLMQRWLKPGECLIFASLLAISPLLVNYSRIARPYAMLALLAAAAIPLAWYWWRDKKPAYAVAWWFCAVFAAWLNPVSLAITTAPFLWFLVEALRSPRQSGPIFRLIMQGLAIAVSVAVLLYSPLTNDWASLSIKTGVHHVSPKTFLIALGLFGGSGSLMVLLALLVLVTAGGMVLLNRDRVFVFYLATIALASTVAVALTGAEWIGQGIVLARYLLGLLPVLLALAAVGLTQVSEAVSVRLGLPGSSLPATAAILTLFLAGPLPGTGQIPNQFMHHMSVQFDYMDDRNPFYGINERVVPEAFYRDIAQRHPQGDAVIVETPWHLESNWNALPAFQAVHGQKLLIASLGGVCADRLYGELRQDIEGLEFRHFVSLRAVLEGKVEADYLVLRIKQTPGARVIEMDMEKCERAVRDSLGDPWWSTDSALVFSLSDAS